MGLIEPMSQEVLQAPQTDKAPSRHSASGTHLSIHSAPQELAHCWSDTFPEWVEVEAVLEQSSSPSVSSRLKGGAGSAWAERWPVRLLQAGSLQLWLLRLIRKWRAARRGQLALFLMVFGSGLNTLLACAALATHVTSYGISGFCNRKEQDSARKQLRVTSHALLPYLRTFLTGGPALWFLSVARTEHLRNAAFLMVALWADHSNEALYELRECEDKWDFEETQNRVGAFANSLLYECSFFFSMQLAVGRLAALETASLQSFGVKRLRAAVFVGVTASVSTNVFIIFPTFPLDFMVSLLGHLILILLWMGIVNGVVIYRIDSIRRLAVQAAARQPSYRSAEAWKSAASLRWQTVGLVAQFLSSGLYLLTFLVRFFLERCIGMDTEEGVLFTLYMSCDILKSLDTVTNLYYALAFSGSMSGAASSAAAQAVRDEHRKLKRERSREKVSAATSNSEKGLEQWRACVRELAGRGVALQAVLSFYRRLGKSDLMPQYDPLRHTTQDVVREAIIPLTSARACAGSTLLMEGAYTQPSRMLTHSWSQLFRDLVSVLVADALQEPDYSMIAHMLTHDLDYLERWVSQSGNGSRVYWVCAFSVNQHVGICGSNPFSTVDTVTGLLHSICPCNVAKVWNHTAPTLADGRSVMCEMNKFVDMMEYLASVDPCFEQVVAVDAELNIFTRAWCIAEMALAYEVGLHQRLKVYSVEILQDCEAQLRSLRIQEMNASRPEDKEDILSRIEDVDAFNSSIQKLLLEELLPEFGKLDGEQQMAHAGRIIRWHQACTSSRSSNLWSAGSRDVGTVGTPVT